MAISEQLGAEHELHLAGGTIRYRERGTGRPIVFVHGALVNGDLWRNIVPALADNHRCITPDWPLGAHETPMNEDADLSPPGLVRLIADFLAALDLEDVTIVGNDTGGGLSQILVTRHPERIGALVLTSCDAFRNFPPHAFKPLIPLGYLPGAYLLTAQAFRSRAAVRLLFKTLAKQPIPDEILDSYRLPPLNDRRIVRDTARFARQIRTRYTRQAAQALPDFGKPALVIWAAKDRLFPRRHGRRLAGLLDARFEVVDDSRTFISEDRPERLVELIAGFLSGSRQADHSPAESTA